MKPGSRYHDEPVKIPKGQGYCLVCGDKTRIMCWGCCMDFPGVSPTCPTSKSDCFQKLHEMRNEIWEPYLRFCTYWNLWTNLALHHSDWSNVFSSKSRQNINKMQKIYVFSRPQTPSCPARLKGKNHKSYNGGDYFVFIQNVFSNFDLWVFSQKG